MQQLFYVEPFQELNGFEVGKKYLVISFDIDQAKYALINEQGKLDIKPSYYFKFVELLQPNITITMNDSVENKEDRRRKFKE